MNNLIRPAYYGRSGALARQSMCMCVCVIFARLFAYKHIQPGTQWAREEDTILARVERGGHKPVSIANIESIQIISVDSVLLLIT